MKDCSKAPLPDTRRSRRPLLAIATLVVAGALTGGPPANAQDKRLSVLIHPALQGALTGSATGAKGGDVTEGWRTGSKMAINWIALDIVPLHDRLLRETSLAKTGIDMAVLIDKYASPENLKQFEPIDNCKGMDEVRKRIEPAFLQELTVDGKLYGLPFRHATTALHYNEALLQERGVKAPFETFEDFIAAARKLTGKRADGQMVHGLAIDGINAGGTHNVLLAYGGVLIDKGLKVPSDPKPLRQTYQLLADLHAEGVLPNNFTAMGIDQMTQAMRTGRVAMVIQPFNRHLTYNDPQRSEYAGKIRTTPIPSLKGSATPVVSKTEFWSFVIPANSSQKEAACELIRQLTDVEATTRTTLNGNSPVQPAIYADPRVGATLPYAAAEKEALAGARFVIVPFAQIGRAQDIYLENMQAAALRRKSAEQAATDTISALTELVKR